MTYKWNNPHFKAYCRCIKKIHENKAWNLGKGADPLYDQSHFHWNRLNDEEKEAAWDFSRMLSVSDEGDPEWNGKDFVAYCKLLQQIQELYETGTEEETDAIRDTMDFHWEELNDEELRLVRLFSSLLNLVSEKEKKNVTNS